MSEIKEGEYVRITDINSGEKIAKIEKILDKDPNYKNEQMYKIDTLHQYGYYTTYVIYKSDIKKHSPNIIDLIEIGDYVNGFKITYITRIEDYIQVRIYEDREQSVYEKITNDNIKSIVTHEQFEEMEYEL